MRALIFSCLLLSLSCWPDFARGQESSPAPGQTQEKEARGPLPPPLQSAPQSGIGSAASHSEAEFQRLAQNNRDLMDLLKRQEAILDDLQGEIQIQNRHIAGLEQRMEEALQENGELKVSLAKGTGVSDNPSSGASDTNSGDKNGPDPSQPQKAPEPESGTLHVPEEIPVPAGQPGWHRLFAKSGHDSDSSDNFRIQARNWRVVWCNSDPPGDTYRNTSACFISAFPRNDVIPVKVCSKLGTGSGTGELKGPGTFMLKVEASGGTWEYAVEEFY